MTERRLRKLEKQGEWMPGDPLSEACREIRRLRKMLKQHPAILAVRALGVIGQPDRRLPTKTRKGIT